MENINRKEIEHLANLSYLSLSKEEIDELYIDIQNILKYVKQLDELDTSNIEPTYQVGNLQNVWREDKIIDEPVVKNQILKLAIDVEDEQIIVPRVI